MKVCARLQKGGFFVMEISYVDCKQINPYLHHENFDYRR